MGSLRVLLVGAFLLLLALPGLQMRFRFVPEERLDGVTMKGARPVVTLAGWWSGELQARFEAWLDENIGFRGHAVRTHNQIGVSIFRESFSRAKDWPVLGRRMVVYDDGYILAYNGDSPFVYTERALHKLSRRLRRLQDALAARGVAFVLLISPSKPSIYPEYLPEGLVHPDGVRPPSSYELAHAMLTKEGVRVVDGRAILIAEKARSPVPLFPPGGIHWNRYAAHLVVRRLFEELERQMGKPLPRLRCRGVREDDAPLRSPAADQEADGADLLNAWHVGHADWTFPRPDLYVEEGEVVRPKLVVVGDSFWNLPEGILSEQRMTSRSDFFYYFKPRGPQGRNPAPPTDGAPDLRVNWSLVLEADAVVVEINEFMIGEAGFGFVEQALEHPALSPPSEGAGAPPRSPGRARGRAR